MWPDQDAYLKVAAPKACVNKMGGEFRFFPGADGRDAVSWTGAYGGGDNTTNVEVNPNERFVSRAAFSAFRVITTTTILAFASVGRVGRPREGGFAAAGENATGRLRDGV